MWLQSVFASMNSNEIVLLALGRFLLLLVSDALHFSRPIASEKLLSPDWQSPHPTVAGQLCWQNDLSTGLRYYLFDHGCGDRFRAQQRLIEPRVSQALDHGRADPERMNHTRGGISKDILIKAINQ